MEKIIEFTPDQLEMIRETKCPPGTPDMEFKRFIHRAETTGLDPLSDQIHLSLRNKKEGDKWVHVYQIIVGIDGFRSYADRTGKLSGIKRGITLNKNGALDSAWAEVYRVDWKFPASAIVFWEEFVQKDKSGKPTFMWAKMPRNQLMKCAEAAAHRMAFPHLAGIYEAAELDQANNEEPEPIPDPPPVQNNPTPPKPSEPAETTKPSDSIGPVNSPPEDEVKKFKLGDKRFAQELMGFVFRTAVIVGENSPLWLQTADPALAKILKTTDKGQVDAIVTEEIPVGEREGLPEKMQKGRLLVVASAGIEQTSAA